MQEYSAVVLGATGATGRHVVNQLLLSNECRSVTALVRRSKPIEYWGVNDTRKLNQVEVDYESLTEDMLFGFDAAFCCLGTTKATAGSAAAFRRVDYEYVVHAGELLHKGGTKYMSLVSSQGANSDSFLLYPMTKGEAENSLKELRFPVLAVCRPGLLFISEERPGRKRWLEWVARTLLPYAFGIKTELLAKAMVFHCENFTELNQQDTTPIVDILENSYLKELVK